MGLFNRLFSSSRPMAAPRPLFSLDNVRLFFLACIPMLTEKNGPEFANSMAVLLIPIQEGAMKYNPNCAGFGDIFQAYASMNREHPEETLEILEDFAVKLKPVSQAAERFLMGHLILAFIGTGKIPKGQSLMTATIESMQLMQEGIAILGDAGKYVQGEG